MNKRYFMAVLLFVLSALVCFVGAVVYYQNQESAQVRGHYALAQLRAQIPLMAHISITTPQNETVSLYRQGDYWHFREAADYYVNNDTLAAFYEFVNNSTIVDVVPATDEQISRLKLGTQIIITDDAKQVLAHFWLARKANVDGTIDMLPQNSQYIYRVSRAKTFFGAVAAWVPMPLLQLDNTRITGIDFNEEYINGEVLAEVKQEFDFMRKLSDVLAFTLYDGIVQKQNFETAYPEIKPQTLKVHVSGGLIYRLQIYAADNSYWLAIDVSTERIARNEAVLAAQSLQRFYADWLFELNAEQGPILYQAGQQQTSQSTD